MSLGPPRGISSPSSSFSETTEVIKIPPRIVEYQAIGAVGLERLNDKINQMLRADYQPFGNIQINLTNSIYIQVMVKYDSEYK